MLMTAPPVRAAGQQDIQDWDPAVPVRVIPGRPVAEVVRDVVLLTGKDGGMQRRSLRVSRLTEFEEAVVSVVQEVSQPPAVKLDGLGSVRENARLGVQFARSAFHRMRAPLRASVPLLDVRGFEPNNISHLLMDIVPVCLFAREALGSEMLCVFQKLHPPFRALLEALGVNVLLSRRRLEGDIVHVRGVRGLCVYDLLEVFDCPSITFLPHVYDGLHFLSPIRAEKIFIARRGERSLLNHADVERMLSARGYETVYMEDYSAAQKLGLAAQARQVVALHGAGMAPLIMSKGLRSLVELLPPNYFDKYYPICLAGRVDRHVMALQSYDERIQHLGWPTISAYKAAPFAMDLGLLEAALDEAEAQVRPLAAAVP